MELLPGSRRHFTFLSIRYVDNKKAERLSRLVGFRLPTALIASSYNKNLSQEHGKVNDKFSVLTKLEENKQKINKVLSDKANKSHEHDRDRGHIK